MTSETEKPKFIVDDMLGKLAVRLRILGFDTTYYQKVEDSFLLRKAKEEERILITRDTHLVKIKMPGVQTLLISTTKLKEQIKEVIQGLKLKINELQMFRRCSVCNEDIQQVNKEQLKDKVPPLVYNLFSQFSYCPQCNKYYWQGTHYERILEELQEFIA